MMKQHLYQVYYVLHDGHGCHTALLADVEPLKVCLWKIQKAVRASSARGAVRKVNTRTKQSENPRPFVNLSELPIP
jgi:hypothetical protein